jgi:hypothetical protein
MQRFWRMIAGLPFVLLTACVASHPGGSQAGMLRLAEVHLRDFGYDPGPVNGLYTV